MITTHRGHFTIEFKNGYMLSIFNDYGSYSSNHLKSELVDSFINNENIRIESEDCEVAILYKNNFVTDKVLGCGDKIKGYVDVEELVEIINKVKNL